MRRIQCASRQSNGDRYHGLLVQSWGVLSRQQFCIFVLYLMFSSFLITRERKRIRLLRSKYRDWQSIRVIYLLQSCQTSKYIGCLKILSVKVSLSRNIQCDSKYLCLWQFELNDARYLYVIVYGKCEKIFVCMQIIIFCV